MALLSCAAKFNPFLSLDCAPHALHPGTIQGMERIKFCHLATLCLTVYCDEDGCVSELLLRLQLVLHVGRDLDEVLLPDPLPVPDEDHAPVGLI